MVWIHSHLLRKFLPFATELGKLALELLPLRLHLEQLLGPYEQRISDLSGCMEVQLGSSTCDVVLDSLHSLVVSAD